jgi:hypothetical protein
LETQISHVFLKVWKRQSVKVLDFCWPSALKICVRIYLTKRALVQNFDLRIGISNLSLYLKGIEQTISKSFRFFLTLSIE